MRAKYASALIFLTLSLYLFTTRPSYLRVRASDSYPVHNLNTGLNYTTINEAINANETILGDTIFVEKGVYNESVQVSKQLHLVGEDRETTIIDGNTMNEAVWLLPSASITNFTIKNGFYGVRVYTYNSPLPQYGGTTIINNRIENALYAGIILQKLSNNTVTENIVTGNGLSGIHLLDSPNNTITGNLVTNNGHGIDFDGYCRDNVLRDNALTANTYNFGLIWYDETLRWFLDDNNGPNTVNDIDTSNTVNGKPIYCWVNRSNEQIPLNAGFVWLTNCNNITVRNLNLADNVEGIMLAGTNNTLIEGNTIKRNAYGIHIALFSNNNTLINNTLELNNNGIYLGEFSSNTTMRNNTISSGQYNFGVPTWEPGFIFWGPLYGNVTIGLNDIDLSNTVNGKPIVYWINRHNMKVPANTGYVMLINCTDITVEGLSLSNNIQNIILVNSNNTLIINNTISNSVHGITTRDLSVKTSQGWQTQPTTNNTITGNTLTDNGIGCRLEEGDCTILNNTVLRNPIGIGLKNIDNSTIAGNTVSGSTLNLPLPPPDVTVFFHPLQHWQLDVDLLYANFGGILFDGKYNVIYDNTIKDNSWGIVAGYQIGYAQGNIVCHNNLINNPYQAWQYKPTSNDWDYGYPCGGNYWSDYNGTDAYSGPYQIEAGSDGIGDTPFSMGAVVDHYPLISPYTDLFDISIADAWISWPILRSSRQTINLSINIINLSVETETFNVTVRTGSMIIATFQNVLLAPGKSTNITCEWDLTSLAYGTYVINASVTPVPDETRVSDNTRTVLTVHTIAGDLNQDRTVNNDDATMLADQFEPGQNQPTGNSNADLNGDDTVDILDAIILANNFGKTW